MYLTTRLKRLLWIDKGSTLNSPMSSWYHYLFPSCLFLSLLSLCTPMPPGLRKFILKIFGIEGSVSEVWTAWMFWTFLGMERYVSKSKEGWDWTLEHCWG